MIFVKCSYSLYVYGVTGKLPHPRDIGDPKGAKLVKWIPQTLSDSIWCVYKFESDELAKEFIDNPDDVYMKTQRDEVGVEFLRKWKVEELQAPTCDYCEPWRGPCGSGKILDNGQCEKHQKKCGCGNLATHGCSFAGQFVCGRPLCDDCKCNH